MLDTSQLSLVKDFLDFTQDYLSSFDFIFANWSKAVFAIGVVTVHEEGKKARLAMGEETGFNIHHQACAPGRWYHHPTLRSVIPAPWAPPAGLCKDFFSFFLLCFKAKTTWLAVMLQLQVGLLVNTWRLAGEENMCRVVFPRFCVGALAVCVGARDSAPVGGCRKAG